MNDMSLYFDYAAATPLSPKSFKVMQPYLSDNFYNPSAIYQKAIDIKKDITQARELVARELGARPSEIVFTAGGTEANNLAINGVLNKYNKSNIVLSEIEHDSVINTAKQHSFKTVKVSSKGIIDLKDFANKIDDNTVLVSVMLANNEMGAIQPIKEIVNIVSEIKKQRLKHKNKLPLLVHTDACQATNYLDINTARLGVDFMTINSGKIYGPKQTGALYVKAGIALSPIIFGGGQEKGLRSGTENVANIIGFAKSLQLVREKSKTEAVRLTKLRDYLAKKLSEKIKNVEINGPGDNKRLANNLHITIPGTDNERMLMELDERGIQVATGSACSASNDEPSHVLKALGKDDNYIFSSLRITMGKHTTKQSCDILIKSISEILAKN